MELHSFITETLLAITKGVENANRATPRFKLSSTLHKTTGYNDKAVEYGEDVAFDIGVIVSETEGSKGVGGIGVSLFSVSGEKTTGTDNQRSHRLQFKVFIKDR